MRTWVKVLEQLSHRTVCKDRSVLYVCSIVASLLRNWYVWLVCHWGSGFLTLPYWNYLNSSVWFKGQQFHRELLHWSLFLFTYIKYSELCSIILLHEWSFSRVNSLQPIDCGPWNSSVRGILQARILEWVAMPSSRGSSQPGDQTLCLMVSCIGRQILYNSYHLGIQYCCSIV